MSIKFKLKCLSIETKGYILFLNVKVDQFDSLFNVILSLFDV
jgi:hypothetical protein